MNLNVKKLESVATTGALDPGGVPWKEAKAQCLQRSMKAFSDL